MTLSRSLFDEGQAIQKYMPVSTYVTPDQECHSRKFAKFVYDGKIKAALRMLDESADQRGVLHLDQETQGQAVRDIPRRSIQMLNPQHLTYSCQRKLVNRAL